MKKPLLLDFFLFSRPVQTQAVYRVVLANKLGLEQGTIGAGIDLATGTTLTAVWRHDIVTEHPDTESPVNGIPIPDWDALLRIAAGCCDLTSLGYIGVDLVLDKDKGPLILEINARPGPSIQVANRTGLLPRLRLVENHHQNLPGIEERIAFSKQHFNCGFHDLLI